MKTKLAVLYELGAAQPYAASAPGTIADVLRVGKLGNSSVRYELGLFKQGETVAAATGYFVHVFVDWEPRRPVPIPPTMRTTLKRLVLPTR
jgi:acyl-CoA thioester hydrolase